MRLSKRNNRDIPGLKHWYRHGKPACTSRNYNTVNLRQIDFKIAIESRDPYLCEKCVHIYAKSNGRK